ncbi:MAG: SRPBCC domain-containing protein [Hyphomonadaceae bacterium]|nr:SRPBCC domain-containing protein [Hyphomonadaceae bacterium]
MSFDIPEIIGAVRREVRHGERDGQPTRIVVATRSYATDIDDLWDAITNRERLPRWFAPVSGDFRLGGAYAVSGNASGTITLCEPPKRLALTWEFAGFVSWVEVDLASEGESARLELRHIAHVSPHWDQFGAGATGVGWELGLLGLYLHLFSAGGEKPPESDPAWAASDEAKTFMRAAGDRWGQAEIAGGETEDAALRRATATKAFYCGEA